MSLSFADSSYIESISQWVTNHQWVGSGQQRSILVVQVDDPTQQYHVQSGFGNLEISASYTPGVDQLDNLIVSFDVPSFGLVVLAEQSAYPLSADPGQNLTVSVAGSITGNVSFKYVGDGNDMEVFSDYILDVPFSDTLQDGTSIFPVDLQRVKTVGSSQSPKRLEGKTPTHLETRTSMFADFLSDVAKDGDRVLIVTYDPPITSDTAEPKEFTINVSFGVLNLVGTVDTGLSISASLYINIPFADRVRIAHLNGALGSGSGSITVDINTVIATGTATLTAEQNSLGTHDLYIDANLNCELIGNISTGKFLLFTSPF